MKRNLRFILLFCLGSILSAAACSDSSSDETTDPNNKPGEGAIQSLTFSPDQVTLVAGESTVLTLTVTPEDADLKNCRWTSSNPDVANIDPVSLTVDAYKAGSTTIGVAYSAEVRATCEVTVTAAPVELKAIEVAPQSAQLAIGGTVDMTATFVPADAQVEGSVVWESSDPSVATVDAQGHVTALAIGIAQITAKAGDVTGTGYIEVYDAGDKHEFTFYQFNIWEGLNNISNGVDAFINQLVELRPDAASFCEFPSTSDAERILSAAAKALRERTGFYYWYNYRGGSGTRGLLTRHPIVETGGVPSANGESSWFYRTTIDFYGQEISVYASHAYHSYYACYLPRGYGDGESPYGWNPIYKEGSTTELAPITDVQYILEREEMSGRTQIAKDLVADAFKQKAAGRLAVFGGDLNQPSHLDWTVEASNLFARNGAVVAWPISSYVISNGMKDAYREIWPDPVTHPGITWPANNPAARKQTTWAPLTDDRDRIDYCYFMPDEKIAVTNAQIVGPTASVAFNKVEEDNYEELIAPVNDIWPSDHRALFITFEVQCPANK